MKTFFLKRNIALSIVIATIGTVLLFCIQFVSLKGTNTQRICAYIVAALFWISIIAQTFVVHNTTNQRRYLEETQYSSKAIKRASIGILSFFKNREALIADAVMIVSFITVATTIIIRNKSTWLIMTLISMLYLSFNLHCIFNSRNYRYLKSFSKIIKEHE